MSAENTSVDALKKQLDALSQEIAALAAAQRKARLVRVALGVGTFTLCIVIVVSFYKMATGMVEQDNLERLQKAAEKRLARRSDDYMRQVQILVDRSSPVLTQAFSNQVKKDLPKYFKIMEAERDLFADELQKSLSAKITRKYEQELARHQDILRKEFPKVENDVQHQRMVKNLQLAIDRSVQKTYVGEMKSEVQKLYATWDQFPAVPPVHAGDPALEDQFVGNLLRLLEGKLVNTQTPPVN